MEQKSLLHCSYVLLLLSILTYPLLIRCEPENAHINNNNENDKTEVKQPVKPLQQEPQRSIHRDLNARLYYSKECQDDISKYCQRADKIVLNDIAVLQCIHNEVQDFNKIDKACHNVNILVILSFIPFLKLTLELILKFC
jgi:hypothetical protein